MASNRGSTPWLQDPDVTLYHGDVLATLRELPAESVDCVVTSPPYWGLRDYGDEGQLGLEPTPEQYVERMVEVFREVRRVLAAHGTVWLNLGDSYAQGGKHVTDDDRERNREITRGNTRYKPLTPGAGGLRGAWTRSDRAANTAVDGLKTKDLCGIPWRVAFALQADGWYLRSDIIWSKPNPMPESVTDRPTKAHEYVFLLSKQPRYFFDQEAVREAAEYGRSQWNGDQWSASKGVRGGYSVEPGNGTGGRNIRSVWEIATQPYPEAHFATFPEELARRCIAAGCPEQVCRVCGKARERVVEHGAVTSTGGSRTGARATNLETVSPNGQTPDNAYNTGTFVAREKHTLGFTDCGHADYRPGIVLDPFMGSGTVAHVARKLGRHAVGIDLNESYLQLAAKRLQQQSLFAEAL